MEQIFDYKKIGREEKRERMRREKEENRVSEELVLPFCVRRPLLKELLNLYYVDVMLYYRI
jgi:hypothetical protein